MARLNKVIARSLHCLSQRRARQPLSAVAVNGESAVGRVLAAKGLDVRELAKLGAEALRAGGVVATPTDTIYGLAASVQNNLAVKSLYDIKGRNLAKPIAISVAEVDDVYRWGKVTVPRELLEVLLPGPVTVVFKRQPELNPNFNADTDLIGIRIPDHNLVRELSRSCGSPLALTSANVSAGRSTVAVSEFANLFSSLALIFDGGNLDCEDDSEAEEARRLGSTVVDLSKATGSGYRLIRKGSAELATVAALEAYGLKRAES